MTKETFYELLADLEEDCLQEAKEPVSRPKRRAWTRFPAAAASLCALLAVLTVTVFAATGWGTKVIDLFTGRTEPGSDYSESGYDLSIEAARVPVSALTGGVQEVSDIIVQQYKDYKPHDSWSPSHWRGEFSSSAEARDYIGYGPLRGLTWDLEEDWTALHVMGDSRGNITQVKLETFYRVGDIRLQAFSDLYTEHTTAPELITGSRTTEDILFTDSRFQTASGVPCHVIASSPMESGYQGLDGYLVLEGVVYHLHIAYQAQDSSQAEDLLHQWAEQF